MFGKLKSLRKAKTAAPYSALNLENFIYHDGKRNTSAFCHLMLSALRLSCNQKGAGEVSLKKVRQKINVAKQKTGMTVVRGPAKRRSIRVCLEFTLVTFFVSRQRK